MGDEWQQHIERRVTALEGAHTETRSALAENTRITREVRDNTAEIIAAFASAKTAFRFAENIGTFVKWTAGIIVAVAGAWALLRSKF